MQKRLVLATLLLSAAPWVGGCLTQHSCTEMGCAGGVTTALGKPQVSSATGLPLVATVCIDDTVCSDVTIDAQPGAQATCEAAQAGTMAFCSVAADGTVQVQQFLTHFANPGGSHEVHVTIRDAQNAVVVDETRPVAITASFPNGEDCEPACYTGTASI